MTSRLVLSSIISAARRSSSSLKGLSATGIPVLAHRSNTTFFVIPGRMTLESGCVTTVPLNTAQKVEAEPSITFPSLIKTASPAPARHSRSEAKLLADRLIVIAGGRLQERPTSDLATLSDAPETVAFGTGLD